MAEPSREVTLPSALLNLLSEKASTTDKRPVVVMTCGIAGSGKSSLSKAIVNQFPSFIRLSIDGYIYDKYGVYGTDYAAERYETLQVEAEEVLKQRLSEILHTRSNNIILDFSFAFKETRDEYRQLITEAGGEALLVYLRCHDVEVLWNRIQCRESAGIDRDSVGGITRSVLRGYVEGFEGPVGEGEVVIDVVG